MWTDIGVYMTQYWAQLWRILEVELPYVGLTFGQLLLGQFIVALSIRIWKAYFGLPSLFQPRETKETGIKPYERKAKS